MRTLKQRLNQSDWIAIAANLVPVYGVGFLGWSAKEVFIVYALETIIIGAYTLLKLLLATLYRKTDIWYNNTVTTKVSGLFFILFFSLHYGLFTTIQIVLFSAVAGINPPNSGLFYFFLHWFDYVNTSVLTMLCGFMASYAARDLFPFIINKEYKYTPMSRLMFQPYGRIFIQQFIVIPGSMLMTLGLEKVFILLFAGIKIFFEVFFSFERILNKTLTGVEKESGKQ